MASDSPLDVDTLVARVRQHMPPYDGTDPNTSATWHCASCYANPDTATSPALKKCSRCTLVYYCNVACQRQHFPQHKAQCHRLRELQDDVQRLGAELSSYNDELSLQEQQEPCNLFEEQTGRFWLVYETRDYCRARCQLAMEMEQMAHEYEVAPLLEKVLNHRLELLRLIMSDNLGLREVVPYTLLRLNQDERCVAFVTHWMRRLADDHDPSSVEHIHEQSSPADWLYGNADPYADIYEAVPDAQARYTFVGLLLPLCIVKLRIIAKHEADKEQLQLFRATSAAQLLDNDSLRLVARRVVGDENQEQRVQRQRELVERYFDIIHEQNKTVLPALVNPAPLVDGGAPPFVQHGKPSEAYFVVMNAMRLFARVPGAVQLLERRFGEQPQYDLDLL